jgi:hypothetical protein
MRYTTMTQARSISLILVSLVASTNLASSANAANPISKVKDIRKDKSGPPLYVGFCISELTITIDRWFLSVWFPKASPSYAGE